MGYGSGVIVGTLCGRDVFERGEYNRDVGMCWLSYVKNWYCLGVSGGGV